MYGTVETEEGKKLPPRCAASVANQNNQNFMADKNQEQTKSANQKEMTVCISQIAEEAAKKIIAKTETGVIYDNLNDRTIVRQYGTESLMRKIWINTWAKLYNA